MRLVEDLGSLYTSETKKYKKRYGIYECPYCLKHVKVLSTHVVQQNIRSCGCLKKINNVARTHGFSHCGNKLYTTWKNITQRCTNIKLKHFKNYGGRGISICEEWKSDFKSFYDWAMLNGYEENLTIDRINNDGNYEPNNCRWATRQEQSDNKRELRITNTSGVKGLNFISKDNLYLCRLTVNNKRIKIGYFKNKEDAIKAINDFKQKNSL